MRLVAIAAAIGLALGSAGTWRFTSWHYIEREAEAIKEAAAADRISLLQTINTLRGQITAATEASRDYQTELTRLRVASQLSPVARVPVCPRATAGQLPAASSATGGPDATSEAGGLVPSTTSGDPTLARDIGPELTALIDEADRCSAQLRGLQAWVTKTIAVSPIQ